MRLLAVAALSGAAVMILELMAVRLMAPWFGQSQLVWTNVIGVVLAALALGQWLGGRAAARGSGRWAAGLLFGAAAVALALPEIVRLLAALVLPDELPLLEAEPFVVGGSLLVALVGLGLPMVALGALTPWLVRLSRDAMEAPARVTGRLLGAGTLGSLIGTFGASHVLLPWVGSAGAVRIGGVLMAAAGVLLASGRRSAMAAAVAVLGLGVAAWSAGGALQVEPRRGELLASVETAYQWARVEELEDGTRLLRLNEGLDSFHSAYVPGQLLTDRYYDSFLLPTLLARPVAAGPRRVLIVGLAAGTMARQVRLLDPEAEIHGVEIDAEIVELGRRFFELPDDIEVAAGLDGRVALRALEGPWSAILVDAYASQIYLPPHLSTREFFAETKARLAPGGVIALNLGGLSVDDPVVDALMGTFADVFANARVQRLPRSRNLLAMACEAGWPGVSAMEDVLLAAGLLPELEHLVDGTRWVTARVGAPVLRDGFAPLEALAHESWRGKRTARPLRDPAPASGQAWIEMAAVLVRAGRSSEAEALLASVPPELSPLQRSRAALLAGNLAFEASRWEQADAAYELSDEIAVSVGVSSPESERSYAQSLSATARGNRDMVAAAMAAQDERRQGLVQLRWAVGLAATTLLGAAYCGLRAVSR